MNRTTHWWPCTRLSTGLSSGIETSRPSQALRLLRDGERYLSNTVGQLAQRPIRVAIQIFRILASGGNRHDDLAFDDLNGRVGRRILNKYGGRARFCDETGPSMLFRKHTGGSTYYPSAVTAYRLG